MSTTFFNSAEISGRVTLVEKQTAIVEVKRRSGFVDALKIVFGKGEESLSPNDYIRIHGELFFSRDEIAIRAFEIRRYKDQEDYVKDNAEDRNMIILDGYISRPPVLRLTSKGTKVLDLKIGVGLKDRGIARSIPCIAFDRIIPIAEKLMQGAEISVRGRLQKRTFYSKAKDDMGSITEVALNKLTIFKEEVFNLRKKREAATA